MKKSTKNEMIAKIVVVGEMAKTTFLDELGPETIDFMVEAALEKLGVEPKKIKKLYMEG